MTPIAHLFAGRRRGATGPSIGHGINITAPPPEDERGSRGGGGGDFCVARSAGDEEGEFGVVMPRGSHEELDGAVGRRRRDTTANKAGLRVSNNSAEAIHADLGPHGLTDLVGYVATRYDGTDPHLLKPDDHIPCQAPNSPRTAAAFIGDSAGDIEAGRGAGVTIIGYAKGHANIKCCSRASKHHHRSNGMRSAIAQGRDRSRSAKVP